MRLAWTTDTHLNFAKPAVRQRFLESLSETADAVAISGDIAESHDVTAHLEEMQDHLQRPIFFVLGNHDFYRGSIVATRSVVTRLAAQAPHLTYLSATTAVELSASDGHHRPRRLGRCTPGRFRRLERHAQRLSADRGTDALASRRQPSSRESAPSTAGTGR